PAPLRDVSEFSGDVEVPLPPPPALGSTYQTRSNRVSVTVPGFGLPVSVYWKVAFGSASPASGTKVKLPSASSETVPWPGRTQSNGAVRSPQPTMPEIEIAGPPSG